MTRIKYDADLIKTISFFEALSGAKVRDCISDDESVLFIVEENDIGRAIGKNAINIKKASAALKKKVRISEFSKDPLRFIENLIHPLKVKDITETDGVVTIVGPDTNTKSLIIGRNASNLRRTEKLAQRHYAIKEIKVI